MPAKRARQRSPSPSRRDRERSSDERSLSRSPSRHPRHGSAPSNAEIARQLKEMKSAISSEFKDLHKRLDTVEKRVADNEGRARSRNLRVYGLDKTKVTEENSLKNIITQLFTDGFLVPADKVEGIVVALDTYHWTKDNALIIAFARRLDLRYIKSLRKNLATYKPHASVISIKDDLEPGQLAIEKECRLKFKSLKTAHPDKKFKIVSFNRIALDNVVKVYSDW